MRYSGNRNERTLESVIKVNSNSYLRVHLRFCRSASHSFPRRRSRCRKIFTIPRYDVRCVPACSVRCTQSQFVHPLKEECNINLAGNHDGLFASERNSGRNMQRYFFLSTTRAAAIWKRPIRRTGTGIGRHRAGYLGTERGTIMNINIRRPRSLWWYGVGRQHVVPLPRISRPCSIRLARAKRTHTLFPLRPLFPLRFHCSISFLRSTESFLRSNRYAIIYVHCSGLYSILISSFYSLGE